MKNLLLKKVRFFVKKLSFMVFLLTLSSGLAFSQATITVTTNADDGAGSLRQAIADAVDGDIIMFSGVDSIALGNTLLLGDKTLTIDGTTAGADVILDGRLFGTEADSNQIISIIGVADKVITLKDLTFQYGYAKEIEIGIDTATTSRGGGLYAYTLGGGTVHAINCTFQNNTSISKGGGVYSNGLNTFENCSFIDNTATDAGDGDGGGASGYGGSVFETCTFTGNLAVDNGGGLNLVESTANKCHFEANEGQDGGGAYTSSATLTESTFTLNVGNRGGGLYQLYGMSSDLDIYNNSTVDGTYNSNGGGVHLNNDGVLKNSTIRDNYTTEAGSDGGGIFIDEPEGVVDNCVVTGNTAVDKGGGIFNDDGTVLNSTFSNNTCGDDGGGMYLDEITARAENCIISNNTSGDHAGGVFIQTGVLVNCIIDSNVGGDDGGGVHIDDKGSPVTGKLIGCVVSNNTTVDQGGGVYVMLGDIINCDILNNTAASGDGVRGKGTWTITNSILYGNGSNDISNNTNTLTVFVNNSALTAGHGLTTELSNSIDLVASPFVGGLGADSLQLANMALADAGTTAGGIDALLPMKDLAGYQRVAGTEVDMGAYESMVAITGMDIDLATTNVGISRSLELTVTVAPLRPSNIEFTWGSLDEAVVTVENGTITGVSVGTAKVWATSVEDALLTDTCLVTVEVVPVIGVALDQTSLTLSEAATVTLTAIFDPVDATNKAVVWTSSDDAIATVVDGVVTGVLAGGATITATTDEGAFTATCMVTVTDPDAQVLNVDMKGSGLAVGDRVFISGGAWNWPQPGNNADLELFDADGDSIYTVIINVCPKMWAFKFFKNANWDNAEPVSADRFHIFAFGETLDLKWGVDFNDVVKDNPLPATFESPNDMAWTTFELGPNTPNCSDFTIVPNPDVTGINASANALQFVVNDNAQPWAGAVSEAYGTLSFTEDFHTLTMMVYKTVISPTALKLEASTDGGPVKELKVTNTKVNEWELLSFDFEDLIGYSYPKLVIFPDFPDTRTAGTTVLLDNIAEMTQTAKHLNVDMNAAGLVTGDRVFVSGSAWNWPEPGTNADLEMFDKDGDGIFSVSLPMCANMWTFKFFKNTGWGGGEAISSDRVHLFTSGNETLSFTWGVHTDDVVKNNPLPATFESTNDMAWGTFELGPNPFQCSDFTIVANPSTTGINTSANALQFVVNDNAQPWAGAYSGAYEPITFTQDMHILSMMVYKTIISQSALKVEDSSDGGAVTEIKVSNTVMNEWELLKFDFSAVIGHTYPKLVFFPDFPATRTAGTTVLLDNIGEAVSSVQVPSYNANGIMVYPNPVTNELNVTFSTPNAKVTIYNSLGRIIEEVVAEGTKVTFDVSHYDNGLYFVKINNSSVVKFVK